MKDAMKYAIKDVLNTRLRRRFLILYSKSKLMYHPMVHIHYFNSSTKSKEEINSFVACSQRKEINFNF